MSQHSANAFYRLKNAILLGASLLVLACACTPAWAGTIMDLTIGNGGIFAYSTGERAPWFYGAGIKVKDLTLGTKELSLLKGRLAFSDRNFLSSSGGGYFWGPGGSLSVTGTLDGVKGTLFTGTFLGAKVVDVNGVELLEAQIQDQLNPQLAALLHLSSKPYMGELDLSLASFQNGRWWTHDKVMGGNLSNSGGNVPEPASIWLLGSSLLGFGLLGLRRGPFRRLFPS